MNDKTDIIDDILNSKDNSNNNIKIKNSIKTEKEEKKVDENNKPDGIQVGVSDKVKNTEIIPEDEINSLIK